MAAYRLGTDPLGSENRALGLRIEAQPYRPARCLRKNKADRALAVCGLAAVDNHRLGSCGRNRHLPVAEIDPRIG